MEGNAQYLFNALTFLVWILNTLIIVGIIYTGNNKLKDYRKEKGINKREVIMEEHITYYKGGKKLTETVLQAGPHVGELLPQLPPKEGTYDQKKVRLTYPSEEAD